MLETEGSQFEPAFRHEPVLIDKIEELLRYSAGAVVVDATVGHGGHSSRLAGRLGPEGRLIGLDVDATSLAVSRERLAGVRCQVTLVRENFRRLDAVLTELQIAEVDVILADLGVNSDQLAQRERGFSFQHDGPLDMRMDQRGITTAGELVNSLSESDLADVIYYYGEERQSRRIARGIVQARRSERLETTGQLAEVVCRSLGIRGTGHRSKIHPATRTFQALRIAVNEELESLEQLLSAAPKRLRAGGQLAIISFHSLEDRRVKNDFRQNAQAGRYEILTRKPVVADEDERRANPRSRSAKLRVARKSLETTNPENTRDRLNK